MGLKEAIQNIWASDYVQKNPNKAYKVSYEAEYAAVAGYLNGGAEPNWSGYSKLGQGLCEAEKHRRAETAPTPEPPEPTPEPPVGKAYFVSDYDDGYMKAPWTSAFSYNAQGGNEGSHSFIHNAPKITQTYDGRDKVVADPAGGSGKVVRFEQRDTDPGWPVLPDRRKNELQTQAAQTFDRAGGVEAGGVRWISTSLFLPYNSNEKFQWAHGGSNSYTDIMDLHPGNGSAWPAFSVQWYPQSGNVNDWVKIRIAGGPTMNDPKFLEELKLFQLTDGVGQRVMANHNRWVRLVYGLKFAPDTTGWVEAWVDGVNVVPRKNRPTMWAGDPSMYLKHGIYTKKDSTFPEGGRSVLYYGRTTIGHEKP